MNALSNRLTYRCTKTALLKIWFPERLLAASDLRSFWIENILRDYWLGVIMVFWF